VRGNLLWKEGGRIGKHRRKIDMMLTVGLLTAFEVVNQIAAGWSWELKTAWFEHRSHPGSKSSSDRQYTKDNICRKMTWIEEQKMWFGFHLVVIELSVRQLCWSHGSADKLFRVPFVLRGKKQRFPWRGKQRAKERGGKKEFQTCMHEFPIGKQQHEIGPKGS
jgi:hypothetical protein